MKNYLLFLKTESKRAMHQLPSFLIKTIILALLAGMIVFYVQKKIQAQEVIVRIGYTAAEDYLTEAAVAYVRDMESVKDWCSFERMEEEEGIKMLQDGELTAFIVLPDNAVEGILTGENPPAKLYLSESAKAMGVIFEELVQAAVGMLQTAQAEIYAASALGQQYGLPASAYEALYADIDYFNLQMVMNREQLLKKRQVSATGGQGTGAYYSGAAIVWLIGILGIFLTDYGKVPDSAVVFLEKRRGVPFLLQQLTRGLFVSLFLLLGAGMAALCLKAPGGQGINPASLAAGLWAVLVSGLWLELFYHCVGEKRTARFLVGMSSLLLGYLSGCILPTALLPTGVQAFAGIFPWLYIRQAVTTVFTGEQPASSVLLGLGYSTVLIGMLHGLYALGRERGR